MLWTKQNFTSPKLRLLKCTMDFFWLFLWESVFLLLFVYLCFSSKIWYNHSSKKHKVNIISYYECEICEYKTMNKYYLSDHTKRQHAGDDSNSFVCHMCYVRKPNSYLLKKHMQQHVESVCKVCEKQFNSTKNLKRHGKVHEVQRCKDCGIYFNAKKDLRNHKLQVHARRKSKKDDPFAAIEDAEFVLA